MEWRTRMINFLKKRSVILGVVIASVTVALGVAGVLFINKNISFTLPISAAEANSLTTIKDELPTRGKIFDRNGKELAVSIYKHIIEVTIKRFCFYSWSANNL